MTDKDVGIVKPLSPYEGHLVILLPCNGRFLGMRRLIWRSQQRHRTVRFMHPRALGL
jgi:hypothetical protein